MKRSRTVIALLVLVVILLSCCTPREEYSQRSRTIYPSEEIVKVTAPIQVLYHTGQGAGTYAVIQVEGHKYLSNWRGGIIHLESCKHEEAD